MLSGAIGSTRSFERKGVPRNILETEAKLFFRAHKIIAQSFAGIGVAADQPRRAL
jgi:hypothetical protein